MYSKLSEDKNKDKKANTAVLVKIAEAKAEKERKLCADRIRKFKEQLERAAAAKYSAELKKVVKATNNLK